MAVTAVSTTGIYCRPGCAARPRPENTATYPTLAAAEAAGFRPCLRCRPDRVPGLDDASDVPPPVAHALILITDGFLDRRDEAALADRVGYSPRQLRRLFTDHVGATPAFIARSRRAHFARRLLDDTDYPLRVIARMAGFGGARQLHRAMVEIFRFTPSELRRKRRQGDRPSLDGGIQLMVPYVQPYDFQATLRHLAPRCVPGVEAVVDGAYVRSVRTCGPPGVVEVSDAGDGRHLVLRAHVPTFDSIIDDVARCRHLFGLDDDPAQLHDALGRDPLVGALLARQPGLRIMGAWDRFETAVRVILGQQVSVAGATTLAGRVAAGWGQPLPCPHGPVTTVFPAAQTLAEADLSGIGMPGARAAAVSTFARSVVDGTIDLHTAGELDELTTSIEALPGFGPWTSQLIAQRVHRHHDAFPGSDLGLRDAVGRLTGSVRPPVSDVDRAAEPWRPWRGWIAQHLWQSLGADAEHGTGSHQKGD